MKQYDKEFKLHAVQLVSECGKPASQVARELGVSQKTLYGWMSRYKEDPSTPFIGSGNLKPDAKALRYLERVSQKMVATIMRENELRRRTVRKYKATTYSNHNDPVQENVLNQTFVAERPNQVYMADITYIPTDEGWVYLASLMDLYSRKIVGWHADARMKKELCITALEKAFKR